MIAVVERASVLEWIIDEVAVNEGFSRDRLVQVRRWQNGKSQHGHHRANRYADPDDSPLQQDSQYTGHVLCGVKDEPCAPRQLF